MTMPAESDQALLDYLLFVVRNIGPVLPLWGIDPLSGACKCPLGDNCKAAGKHPNSTLCRNGVKGASSDENNVRMWAERNAGGNWGLKCGVQIPDANSGYLAVIDVDTHSPDVDGHDTLRELEQSYGPLPDTVRAISGGNGTHILLRSPSPIPTRSLGPSVDLRAEGAYIVIAPSLHKSGKSYTWDAGHDPSDTRIAAAPKWMLENSKNQYDRPKWNGRSARETLMGEAFAQAGMLGQPLGEGRYAVRCPQAHMHTDARGGGTDSSSCILPPLDGTHFGSYICLHAHCAALKWDDVLALLPKEAVHLAKQKYPLRPSVVGTEAIPNTAATAAEATTEYSILSIGGKSFTVPSPVFNLLAYKVSKNGDSAIIPDATNLNTILSFDPRWANVLKFNQFSSQIVFTRLPPPWHPLDMPADIREYWRDQDVWRMRMFLQRFYGISLSEQEVYQAVRVVAERSGTHPVRDWLVSLKWDGKKRLDGWAERYLGAKDTPYHRAVARWWLISGIARVIKPGTKVDTVLILEGPQGALKSTALATLAMQSEWFSDTPIDLNNKDAYVNLRGRWIVELAELDSLNRSDTSRAKAFFSSSHDTYRVPYGKESEQIARQCIFAGTVNFSQYLKDASGNRRYWPIRVGRIDIGLLRAERAQLWAEAYQEYLAGAKWWPETEAEQELCRTEQEQRLDADAWMPVVADWLDSSECAAITSQRGFVTPTDILARALNLTRGQWDRGSQARVGSILMTLGWDRSGGGYVRK